MKNTIKSILFLVLCLYISSNLALAQDIDGEYSASGTNHVTNENNKMVVTRNVYEFYGQPNTEYRYMYKLIWVDENLIKLKLKNARITAGAKRFGGASRRRGYDGTYNVKTIHEDIELTNAETLKDRIQLKRDFRKNV